MQTLLRLGPNSPRSIISRPSLSQPTCQRLLLRKFSTKTPTLSPSLRRSYLYVPSSSDKMLEKTKTSDSDVFVYDLEDSIAPNVNDKVTARERLKAFLAVEFYSFQDFIVPNVGCNWQTDPIANRGRVGVRVNGIGTPFFEDDIKALVCPFTSSDFIE